MNMLNNRLQAALEQLPFNKPPTTEALHDIEVRISGIPDDIIQTIERINSSAIGKFCCFEGMVLMATDVKPKIKKALFQCKRCKTETAKLLENEEMKSPVVCEGCDRPKTFELVESKCHYVDWCKIQFQEPLEKTRDTANPPKIVGWVEGDETLNMAIGQRYKVSGVLETRKTNVAHAVHTKMLRINHIEPIEQEDEVDITQEEQAKIEKFAKSPHLYDLIIPDSWAPTVYGYKEAKLGAFLNVIGGNDTLNPLDKSANRASIHVLLIGEPGVAKSKLAKYTQQVERKCIYTTGGGTTAGGLTAIAEKSDFGEGGWVIKAGALVIASGGTVVIDEFDKTPPETKASIHEAMEQQQISISKAGISTQFAAKTNILAVANPKYSRFDQNKPIIEQFNLQPSLISRFDLIFPIKDQVSEEKDNAIADTILKNRQDSISGQVKKNIISPELMTKYLILAKKMVPTMSAKTQKVLTKYYIDIRKRSTVDSLTITPRQLEAIARISEAFAKGRLAREVSEDDVKRAISLMEYTLKEICPSDSGTIDIDMIMADVSSKERKEIEVLKTILADLENSYDMVGIEHLQKEAFEQYHIPKDASEKLIKEALRKGDFYEPRSNYIKTTKR
jgi:replicative DNA helicase Mcm